MLNKNFVLHTAHALILLAALTSCDKQDMVANPSLMGRLCLKVDNDHIPVVTRSAQETVELKVTILDVNGTELKTYQSSQIPSLIDLPVGNYTLRSFSNNQSSWQSANNGLGEGCFLGQTTFVIKEDHTTYCHYQVPMTNFGVSLTLPEGFCALFSDYKFTVNSGERTLSLLDGQIGYFSSTESFSYYLKTTNTDGQSNQTEEISVSSPERGKIYDIKYNYNF